MTTATYDIGDKKRLSILFTDSNDQPADPGAVTASVTEPDGTEVLFAYPVSMNRTGQGQYCIDYLFTKHGRHKIRFKGTGTITAAEQADVYIRRK